MEKNRKKRPFFATVALSNNFPYRSETSFLCRMSVSYVVKDRQIDFLVTRNIFFLYIIRAYMVIRIYTKHDRKKSVSRFRKNRHTTHERRFWPIAKIVGKCHSCKKGPFFSIFCVATVNVFSALVFRQGGTI